jgi:vacuolar-type H+-ATPase subunit B/Vma2
LDTCWHLLSQCFDKDEVIIKKELKNKYWVESNGQAGAE